MSGVVANVKREELDEMTKYIDFDRYIYGANYVPLEVAIYLQCQVNVAEESEVVIDTCMDDNGDRLPARTINIQNSWLEHPEDTANKPMGRLDAHSLEIDVSTT
eukprot:6518230-Ditylum_brightwellii.AAC.1